MSDFVGAALNVGSFGLIDKDVFTTQTPTIQASPQSEEARTLSNQQRSLLDDLQRRQQRGLGLTDQEANQLTQLQRQVQQDVSGARQLSEAALPELFATLGFRPEVGEDGRVTGISRLSAQEQEQLLSPLQQQNLQIAQQTASKQLAALRGDVDADLGLERELEKSEQRLKESLARRLGSGFEETTVGQAALNNFNESSTRLRQESRNKTLSEGSLAVAQTTALVQDANAQNRQRAGQLGGAVRGRFEDIGLATSLATQVPSAGARVSAGVNQALPLLTAGFESARQPFQFQQQLASGIASQQAGLQFQANAANTAFNQELFGTAVGIAAGAA